jgi:two-component system chemotaxis sensor kinase CheA
VSLKLPLSMAVTRVMVVVVAGQRFGIPVEHIRETLRKSPEDVKGIGHHPAIELRGHVVPLFDLGEELGLYPAEPEEDAVRILVVAVGGEEVGLIVERFEDHFDLICKPPDGVLAGNPALSGTALLGDGQVLLVLNIREVLGHAVAVA